MGTQGSPPTIQTHSRPVLQRTQSMDAVIQPLNSSVQQPMRLDCDSQQVSLSSLVNNCYAIRADEIGLKHGVPGVGSIEHLLTPSGWQCGQDPMTEDQAKAVFENARAKAKADLETLAKGAANIGPEERRAQMEKKEVEWQAERKLDEVIFLERVKLARAFVVYKQSQAQHANGQQQQGMSQQGLRLPAPLHPRTHTSFPIAQHYQQAQRQGASHHAPSPTLDMHQRLRVMQQGKAGKIRDKCSRADRI